MTYVYPEFKRGLARGRFDWASSRQRYGVLLASGSFAPALGLPNASISNVMTELAVQRVLLEGRDVVDGVNGKVELVADETEFPGVTFDGQLWVVVFAAGSSDSQSVLAASHELGTIKSINKPVIVRWAGKRTGAVVRI